MIATSTVEALIIAYVSNDRTTICEWCAAIVTSGLHEGVRWCLRLLVIKLIIQEH